MRLKATALLLSMGCALALGIGNATKYPGLLSRLGENDQEDADLNWLLTDISIRIRQDVTCLLVMTDKLYYGLLQSQLFRLFKQIPTYRVLVKDYEDLLSPYNQTLDVIKEARGNGCNAYIILIANGHQVGRFLRFGDKNRVLDTRAQYVLLHDRRLFPKELIYIWKRIISVLFLRRYEGSQRYEISTVPYPSSPEELRPLRIDSWKRGRFQKNIKLFWDKSANLRGEVLRVGTFEHMPSVVKVSNSDVTENDYLVIGAEDKPIKYEGLEVQILKSISDAMNFEVTIYEPSNANSEAWGKHQPNGSFTGLYGEVTTGRAEFVLGNFHYSPYNLELMDLSRPYTTMCFTFLTPESTTDNSWKTLIAPFRLPMWIAIFVTLVVTSIIFYGLARLQMFLNRWAPPENQMDSFWKDILVLWHHKKRDNMLVPRRSYPFGELHQTPTEGLYLFSKIGPSVMSTYSMLLSVSLPKMPTGWSLRMMTGWWYMYCLLVTVAYRASMTAILARPAQRFAILNPLCPHLARVSEHEPQHSTLAIKVTIDTLEELASSKIGCGGWGEQNKELFTTSLDSAGQRVGSKFEVTYDSNKAITKVAEGNFAYYENIFFLQNAKVKEKLAEAVLKSKLASDNTDKSKNQDLHIMGNCAINVPVSLGLEKNSPLKPRVDVILQRVIEAGLVKKWLLDVMIPTKVAEAPLMKTEVKALMDLKKFQGALIALVCGLVAASIALGGEIYYWRRFILRIPLFEGPLFVRTHKD